MYWFTEDNYRILSENGINDNFVWGEIQKVHTVGDIQIVEYASRHEDNKTQYHIYVDGKDSRLASNTLDEAILGALGFKYDGRNSQFAYFALKMLGQ